MINSVPPTLNSIHGREKCFKHNNFSITIFSCHVAQWSQIWLHLLNFRKERVWIPAKTYRISSNNSCPSINRLPQIIAPLWWKYLKYLNLPSTIDPPPHPPSHHLVFLLSPPCQVEGKFYPSKLHQWWFKLWKLIKEPNMEHLKSPCSVYLMW